MNKLNVNVPPDEPLIAMARTFDAPRALVWKAMTDPGHLARWWGPRKYTNKVTAYDLRPGGKWRIEQSDAEGRTFAFHGEFREVVPRERIVQTFGMEGMFDGRVIVETMTLREKDGRTLYAVTSRFDTIADRDGMVASGMEGGASESMERLDELLAEMRTTEKA